MNTVKIPVSNGFFRGVKEEFITRVDLSDLNEVEMAADECCGQYLELHGDLIHALTPDVNWETIAEACDYMIEEVIE